MSKQEDYNPWVDVVLAMLSTGGHRLERTYNCCDMLIDKGLTDPLRFSSMAPDELARKQPRCCTDSNVYKAPFFPRKIVRAD